MRLIALATLALTAACATETGPAAADRFDRFEPSVTSDFTGYDRVYIAPVTASDDLTARIDYRPIGPQDRIRPLSQRIIDQQAAEFAEELTARLSKVATIADAPGPGVLTIQAELTDLNANRPTIAEFRASPGLSFESISVGDAAVQVVLSEDGRELATLQDRAFRRNLDDPTVGVGIWGTAYQFYDRFSSKMAALLS